MTPDEAMQALQAEIDKILADGSASHDIDRMIKRLMKFCPELFTYLTHDGVSPDNSEAERMIRYFVAQRKISGKFINEDVRAAESMLLSVFQTCAMNDVAYENVLPLIIQGNAPAVVSALGLDGEGAVAVACDCPPEPSPPPLPTSTVASS